MEQVEVLPLKTSELIIEPSLRPSAQNIYVDAQSPFGGTWQLAISPKTRQRATLHSRHEVNTLGKCVTNVAANPIAIFQGLRGENADHSEGLAYVGAPPVKYAPRGELTPNEDEFFFFFTCCERRIFSWRWEICSQKGHLLLPELIKRFERLVWKP